MKIASGTCFYNDCRSLERTLESLKDKVDLMICVDGRFKHYNDDNDSGLSNDGSRELVKTYPNAMLVSMPNCYEIQKRQAYVDECGAMSAPFIDFLLIIDSDEYILEYDEKVFRTAIERIPFEAYQTYNVFAIMLEINSGKYEHIIHKLSKHGPVPPTQATKPGREKQFAHSPRLWFKPGDMEYNMTHYTFRNKNPASSLHNMETNPAVQIVPGMKIGHDHELRRVNHLDRRFEYQKWLVDFEQNKLMGIRRRTKITPKISEYDNIDRNKDAD